MRFMSIEIASACLLVIVLTGPASAQSAANQGPCGQILAACRDAGFTQGGVRAGTGLFADCVVPIVQGMPQPRRARTPLPQVDPQLVAECKASNPRFGSRTTPMPRGDAGARDDGGRLMCIKR